MTTPAPARQWQWWASSVHSVSGQLPAWPSPGWRNRNTVVRVSGHCQQPGAGGCAELSIPCAVHCRGRLGYMARHRLASAYARRHFPSFLSDIGRSNAAKGAIVFPAAKSPGELGAQEAIRRSAPR